MLKLLKTGSSVYNKDLHTTVDLICNGDRSTKISQNKFSIVVKDGVRLLSLFGYTDQISKYRERVKSEVVKSILDIKRKQSSGDGDELHSQYKSKRSNSQKEKIATNTYNIIPIEDSNSETLRRERKTSQIRRQSSRLKEKQNIKNG